MSHFSADLAAGDGWGIPLRGLLPRAARKDASCSHASGIPLPDFCLRLMSHVWKAVGTLRGGMESGLPCPHTHPVGETPGILAAGLGELSHSQAVNWGSRTWGGGGERRGEVD